MQRIAFVVSSILVLAATFVRDLRALADELEGLPIRDAGEVLAWLAPHLERLRHEADRVFQLT